MVHPAHMMPRNLMAAALLTLPHTLAAQVATIQADTADVGSHVPDGVRSPARDAQASFERTRLRHARLGFGSGGGDCDEYVGRFCTSYGEGEWYPRGEDDEVVEAREALLSELDSLQRLAPGDGWILGQRVWYTGEAGDWEGALVVARDCGSVQSWWCAALEGLALHGLHRYPAALRAFETALERMDPALARDWRVPERAVDRDARGRLRDSEKVGPDSLTTTLARLWTFADPLFLVDGNDRLTEHYARWTVSTLKEDARNPYGIRWGDDLEELTVRHGWEVGWERSMSTLTVGREGAVGHKHPEGRDYMPAGRALRDPAAATTADLTAGRREPRSLYAPDYAPVLLPAEADVAVFPRGSRSVLIATPYLPDDTTFHATHEHPKPWLDPGDQAGMPDQIGLFAIPVAGGELAVARATGSSEGTLMLDVPAGEYLVSAESWSPERRRAGRVRLGLRLARTPEDVATASDLLLLRGGTATPASLEQVLPLALPRPRIRPGDALAVAWEISGLGFRPETLEYALSVERTDRGVFRRIGELFGLADRSRPVSLAWQEPAPDHPTHQFRYLDLDLPPLVPGRYEITLTLSTAVRSDVVVTKTFEVIED